MLCFLFNFCCHFVIVQVSLVVGLEHNPNTHKLLLDCVLGTRIHHLLLERPRVWRPAMVRLHDNYCRILYY